MNKMSKAEKKNLRAIRRDARSRTAQGMGALAGFVTAMTVAAAILPEGRKAVGTVTKLVGDVKDAITEVAEDVLGEGK